MHTNPEKQFPSNENFATHLRVAAELARQHVEVSHLVGTATHSGYGLLVIARELDEMAERLSGHQDARADPTEDTEREIGDGSYGSIFTKRWFYDRAKLELERNASGRATLYLGDAHIREDDDSDEAEFDLAGVWRPILQILESRGIEAHLDDVRLAGDLHPAESYGTFEHEIFITVPLEHAVKVREFLRALQPYEKVRHGQFWTVDLGIMESEAVSIFGSVTEG